MVFKDDIDKGKEKSANQGDYGDVITWKGGGERKAVCCMSSEFFLTQV